MLIFFDFNGLYDFVWNGSKVSFSILSKRGALSPPLPHRFFHLGFGAVSWGFWAILRFGLGLLVTRTFSNHLFVIALRVFQLQRDDNSGFDMPRVWLLFGFVLVWWDGG